VSLLRSSVSLCCTSGWLTIVTPSIAQYPAFYLSMIFSENRSPLFRITL
jgi:hypothetical protein